MADRSTRLEVRNPVLALPGVKAVLALPPEVRAVLAGLFTDIALDCRARANKAWFSHKAPMAAYWKAVSVYAGHIARVLKRGRL